jgi:hypothetical protein
LIAQPVPGDVFMEYVWLPEMVVENEKFLRVGGKLDYKISEVHFPQHMHKNGHIPLGIDLDLQDVIKAELVLEKVQSHEDTKGLQVQINGNPWLDVPDAGGIPKPQSAYMHHYYPVVNVPTGYLKAGMNNTVKLQVNHDQKWDWPQNIFYGLIFRIYYKPSKTHAEAEVNFHVKPEELELSITRRNTMVNINRVEYIGLYEDFNFEGDGIFRQWHYNYHKGKIINHIGTSGEGSYICQWNISWLPDQDKPIEIGARIIDQNSMIYFTKAEKSPDLPDRPYKVVLYKTDNIPENFVTRENAYTTDFYIRENLYNAISWQIAWISWSPGYANGIYVNDVKILDQEGPKYVYYIHLHEFHNAEILRQGQNEITTGKTPLYDGKMVHGMEVQWPGMMVKVKYKKPVR